MIDFVYTARDLATDQIVKAEVKAESPEAAAKLLLERKLFPIEVKPRSQANILTRFGIQSGVSAKDRVLFTRQLSTLINAGLPLSRALRSVQDQISHEHFREIIESVVASVEGGSSLSQAFAQHPRVFNEIYVSLVAAGETSGTLDKTLLRLADQQEKDAAIASKIRSAMIYPAIVLVLIIGVVILMVVSVVPQVSQLYQSLGQALPLPTKILIWLSHFLTQYWWLNVIALIILGVLLRKFTFTEVFRRWSDRVKLTAPVFGKLLKKVYMARFARTMAALLGSGIPMLQAMDTTRRALANRWLQEDMDRAIVSVRGGKALSEAIAPSHYFIPLVPQMISIGEESGTIDEMMERVAKYYEAEVDEEVANLSTTIEPVMMVVLGGIVALVLAAVLGPIYSLVGSGSITNSSSGGSSTSSSSGP
ncbi:MAG TPA: type II secretion system F family protein [Candidatus Saccharimonadales bacterium]|nr:type II secretion system F family protein [Candidatus Saccharimonadales bacterium]